MKKQSYKKPEITKVSIDNEISVVLMSAETDGTQGLPPGLPEDPGQG